MSVNHSRMVITLVLADMKILSHIRCARASAAVPYVRRHVVNEDVVMAEVICEMAACVIVGTARCRYRVGTVVASHYAVTVLCQYLRRYTRSVIVILLFIYGYENIYHTRHRWMLSHASVMLLISPLSVTVLQYNVIPTTGE